MIIAIDGPSGAGKSTIAKAVATELGIHCLDTGAMYRAVARLALDRGVSLDDDEALGELARENDIAFELEDGNPSYKAITIDGIDVTARIRDAQIDKAVTPVSAAPPVREALLGQQRRIGSSDSYVVEGRDIGTVVFPNADVKIFLTASPEERARRRVAQNLQRGNGNTDFEAVLADLNRRDIADSTRAVAPLRQADDAVLVDSTDMTIPEVVARICGLAHEAQAAAEQAR